MGLYIVIKKQQEDAASATYKFYRSENIKEWGILKVQKSTGEITFTEPIPNDPLQIISARAARKVFLHWQEGLYPTATQWAS